MSRKHATLPRQILLPFARPRQPLGPRVYSPDSPDRALAGLPILQAERIKRGITLLANAKNSSIARIIRDAPELWTDDDADDGPAIA